MEEEKYRRLILKTIWINIQLVFIASGLFALTNLMLYLVKYGYDYLISNQLLFIIFCLATLYFVFFCSLVPVLVVGLVCIRFLRWDILSCNLTRRKSYFTYIAAGLLTCLIVLSWVHWKIGGRINTLDELTLVLRTMGINVLIATLAGERLYRLSQNMFNKIPEVIEIK